MPGCGRPGSGGPAVGAGEFERLGPLGRHLLPYWSQLPARECVPERSSFDPMAVARILPVVTLLQRIGNGEWRFRLIGTEIGRRWGRNFTGADYLTIDFVSTRAAATMRREFTQICEWPCGSWSRRGVAFVSGRHTAIETLRLPLRAADGSVSLILSCSEELAQPRDAPEADAARGIITITEQQFLDIGAGCPSDGAVLGAAPAP